MACCFAFQCGYGHTVSESKDDLILVIATSYGESLHGRIQVLSYWFWGQNTLEFYLLHLAYLGRLSEISFCKKGGIEVLEYKHGLFWRSHLHPLMQNHVLIYIVWIVISIYPNWSWVEYPVYSKQMPEEGPLKRCCPPETVRLQVTEGVKVTVLWQLQWGTGFLDLEVI